MLVTNNESRYQCALRHIVSEDSVQERRSLNTLRDLLPVARGFFPREVAPTKPEPTRSAAERRPDDQPGARALGPKPPMQFEP